MTENILLVMFLTLFVSTFLLSIGIIIVTLSKETTGFVVGSVIIFSWFIFFSVWVTTFYQFCNKRNNVVDTASTAASEPNAVVTRPENDVEIGRQSVESVGTNIGTDFEIDTQTTEVTTV